MTVIRRHHWRYDPRRRDTDRRPAPSCTHPPRYPDAKVLQFIALIDASGALQQIERKLAGRPGPAGLPARTVLVGLLLSLYYRGKANIDAVSEILHLGLSPRMQALLGIQAIDGADSCQTRAAYVRCTRALDAITTAFDPHRHDRRKRLNRAHAEEVKRSWDDPANARLINDLSALANTLIQSVVTVAVNRRLLRHWPGDIGVDDTPAVTWGRNPTRRRGPLDIGAGWYRKGGSKDKLWAYSLSLAITGHANPAAAERYPQLCLSMQIHTPNRYIGESAIKALYALEHFAFRKNLLAGDRAYSMCKEENFQSPARALGYQLLLDYESGALGKQGTDVHGAIWRGGQLYCPAMPRHLFDAGKKLSKNSSKQEQEEGRKLVQKAEKYRFQTKEKPQPDGSWRAQCPAAGPSPTVTCPRAETRGTKRRPVPVTVNLDDLRARLRHPAALPRVAPQDLPREDWPDCCEHATVTVLANSNAKYQQSLPHGMPEWETAYKHVRAHNEGANGWLKGADASINAAVFRQARGRVAQTILIALTIAVANLRRLEQFLRDRHEDPATLLDHLPLPGPGSAPQAAAKLGTANDPPPA